MIGLRVTEHFKQFLKELADAENRSLSSFIENAILYYITKEKGIDYKKNKKP
jgi:predicted transcriptional regulator